MIRALHLVMPWPPTINTYYMSVRGTQGRMLTKRARQYRHEALAAIMQVRGSSSEPITGRLRLEVELRPPDRRSRDLDNYLKALLDGMTHGGVWGDDSQIDELVVTRGRQVKDGQAVCMVTEIEEVV